jgi:hypothetical protein
MTPTITIAGVSLAPRRGHNGGGDDEAALSLVDLLRGIATYIEAQPDLADARATPEGFTIQVADVPGISRVRVFCLPETN